MYKVVIGYNTFPDLAIEKQVLDPIGAEVIGVPVWDSAAGLDAAAQADGLLVSVQPVNADLIARMDRCKVICRIGSGLDAIDIPAATRRGMWVTNVPDYAIDEVSTHAIGMLLNLSRRLPRMLSMVKEGMWLDTAPVKPIHRLRDQTLGVLGYGRIGRATAAKGRAMGLTVIAHDPHIAPETMAADGVRDVDFNVLLSESDYLTLHMPLTDTNRQIINARTLAQMKPSAYIINTARGALIDQKALYEAVQAGKLAGAALDVLATEPPSRDDPLLNDERILITPHVAWYSEEAADEVRRKGAQDVARVLQGERPLSPANQVS